MSDADQKKLNALSRASEAYIAIDLIIRHSRHLETLLKNHDPSIGDNATRRDCETFQARIRELGLTDLAQKLSQPPA